MNWLGALLLVISAYFCGIKLAHDEGERLKALDSIIDLLEFMHRRMNAERTPLYLLFASFEDEYLESVGFLPVMRSCRSGLTPLWQEAVSKLPLDTESERELLHFGESLGALPLDTQSARLSSCLSALADSRAKLRDTLPAKQKSIKTVSLLFGALAAIILM